MPTSRSGPAPPEARWPTADEAAARSVRNVDWGSTSLGRLDDWPANLKACVQIMLNMATPVALAWGDELTIIPNGAWSGRVGSGADPVGRSAGLEASFPWPALRNHLRRALREGTQTVVTTDEADASRFRVTPFFGDSSAAAGLWIDAETPAGPQPNWLPLALDAGRLAIWDWEPASGRMVWSDALYRLLGFAPGEVQPSFEHWLSRIHPEDTSELSRAMQTAVTERSTIECSFRAVRPDQSVVWCETRGRVTAGEPAHVTGVVEDVTELALARSRQRKLEHDLLHRVRNILAIIRSIVLRTAETRQSVDDFARHLEGRIDTLARHQSMLLQNPRGVDLQALLLEELRRASAAQNQTSLHGAEVSLPPRVAQTLCLAFHELTTNAIKFGALSHDAGRLNVTWSLHDDELDLVWRERGISIPTAPPHRGFGMSLIEKVLPYELGARVVSDFARAGFSCQLVVPLRRGAR